MSEVGLRIATGNIGDPSQGLAEQEGSYCEVLVPWGWHILVPERLGKEGDELEDSLGYIVRPYLNKSRRVETLSP